MIIRIQSKHISSIIFCVLAALILTLLVFNKKSNETKGIQNLSHRINSTSLKYRMLSQQKRRSVLINQSILVKYRTKQHQEKIKEMVQETKNRYEAKIVQQKKEQPWKIEPLNQNITKQKVLSAIEYLSLKDKPTTDKLFRQNQQYYSKNYNLSNQQQTSPLCVVISSHNNQQNILNLLKTISYQSFKNYHVIVADSDSSDMTISKAKQFYKHQSVQIDYIQSKYRGESVRQGILNYCQGHETVILIDANHEIIGSQVFRLLSILSSRGLWLIYTNYLTQDHKYGKSKPIKQELLHGPRKKIYKMGGIRAFKAKMFHKIRLNDLKTQYGQQINQGYLQTIQYPLMEMAGIQRIKYLNEICYFEHEQVYQNEDQEVLTSQYIEYLKDCIMELQRYSVLDDDQL